MGQINEWLSTAGAKLLPEEGRRAILLRLPYRDPTRSVTDEIVQPLHDAIIGKAIETLRQRDDAVRVR